MKTLTRPIILLFVVTIAICITAMTNALWLSLLLIPLVALVVDIFNSELNTADLFCGIFFLTTITRIKTDYGRFYILFKPDENRVLLVRDRFFYLENMGYTSYYGDLESLKKWTKAIIVSKTEVKRTKSELTDSIKSWNGCLDKTSERDHKLNEIL